MNNVWYTKSMKSLDPIGLIHLYENQGKDFTLCGKEMNSPRWYIGLHKPKEVTCPKCNKRLKHTEQK